MNGHNEDSQNGPEGPSKKRELTPYFYGLLLLDAVRESGKNERTVYSLCARLVRQGADLTVKEPDPEGRFSDMTALECAAANDYETVFLHLLEEVTRQTREGNLSAATAFNLVARASEYLDPDSFTCWHARSKMSDFNPEFRP